MTLELILAANVFHDAQPIGGVVMGAVAAMAGAAPAIAVTAANDTTASNTAMSRGRRAMVPPELTGTDESLNVNVNNFRRFKLRPATVCVNVRSIVSRAQRQP